ncbi:MAG: SHOCT domain-containing protein [Anaerolineales bacterium]
MMMGFGLIGVVLVVILIAVLLSGKSQGNEVIGRSSDTLDETAREILEKRYARGEISKQEFDQISGDL